MNKNNNNNKNNKISSQQICCILVAANVLLAATCSSQLVATACQLICLSVRLSVCPLARCPLYLPSARLLTYLSARLFVCSCVLVYLRLLAAVLFGVCNLLT